MKTVGVGCRMRAEGPKIEAEGRDRDEVLGEGQQAPRHDHYYFQHPGWPLLTIMLLIVDKKSKCSYPVQS